MHHGLLRELDVCRTILGVSIVEGWDYWFQGCIMQTHRNFSYPLTSWFKVFVYPGLSLNCAIPTLNCNPNRENDNLMMISPHKLHGSWCFAASFLHHSWDVYAACDDVYTQRPMPRNPPPPPRGCPHLHCPRCEAPGILFNISCNILW
jgi:hypothetical protein